MVWLENPTCAGVLIEPDIVLSLKTCLGSHTSIVWPYRTRILETIQSPDANLAILKLGKSLPNPVPIIQMAERSFIKEGCPIYFSNLQQSTSNWIDRISPESLFLLDGLEPPLLGSPVLTSIPGQGERVVGLLTKSKQAIRLESYYAFIFKGIQFIQNGNKTLESRVKENGDYLTLPAIPIQESLRLLAIPVSDETQASPSVNSSHLQAAASNPDIPQSLGCRCSQVRRTQEK
ncbi:MAG: hypothetical protein I8H75_00320 [Myxococcaceae bacterium]|nr:hypothetical protein [Myxococcaceae bacterium]